MTTSRMVWFLIVLIVAELGCSPSGTSNVSAQKQAAIGPASISSPKETAEDFARSFVNSVQNGKATSEQLTTELKKIIARPVFPSEMTMGYSDVAAMEWLKRLENQLNTGSITPLAGSDEAPGFVGPGWMIRLVPASGSWKVDWLGIGPTASNPSLKGTDVFTVSAFLTAVLGKQDAQAAALLTNEFKQRLAPPFSTDKAGFNQGLLSQRLSELRERASGYTVVSLSNGTAQAELLSSGTRRKVTLKLTRGERSWEWLITDYKLE